MAFVKSDGTLVCPLELLPQAITVPAAPKLAFGYSRPGKTRRNVRSASRRGFQLSLKVFIVVLTLAFIVAAFPTAAIPSQTVMHCKQHFRVISRCVTRRPSLKGVKARS